MSLSIAGAALLTGGLLGFLFGIPRTLQQETPEGSPQNPTGKVSYRANTNLEDISDWLTKILVGVGLTQISSIPGTLQKYAEFTSSGLGNYPNSGVFAMGLGGYFLIGGFLFGYLITRLYLPGAFRRADINSERLTKIEGKVSELEERFKDK